MKAQLTLIASLALLGCSPEMGSNNPTTDREPEIVNEIPRDANAALDWPARLELFSLEPSEDMSEQGFHGWKVLGKTDVLNMAQRKPLVAAFRNGVEEHDGSVALCFWPRHAIRLRNGERTMEFVICFECLQVEVFRNGEPAEGFLISESPQQTFDACLKAAGVPLAPKAH
jgi:hypothetical protein